VLNINKVKTQSSCCDVEVICSKLISCSHTDVLRSITFICTSVSSVLFALVRHGSPSLLLDFKTKCGFVPPYLELVSVS